MTLYQLAREGSTDELASHLAGSDSPAVRARAAELLGDAATAEDDDAVGALVSAATDDPEQAVRGAAVDALDQLGRAPLEALIGELADVDPDAADWAAAREYAAFLGADQPELRLAAATVLGRVGDERTASRLADRFEDPDARVRARAVRACGQIGAGSVVPALADVLATDESAPVRREAATAMGAISDDRGLSALVDALDDPHSDVRRAAVVSVGEFGDPSPVGAVAGLLTDPDEAVRQATAFALVDLLANAPADRSHEVRESIVDELGAIEQPDGVFEPLVDILDSGAQPRHRRNVVWLLGRIADEDPPDEVVDALAAALCSSERTIARFAATSLVAIGGDSVESALIDALEDETLEDDARANAAFALGKVGGERAKNRLELVVEEIESETLRQRAFAALSKLETTVEDPVASTEEAEPTPGQRLGGGENA